jgi:hypothetical protein
MKPVLILILLALATAPAGAAEELRDETGPRVPSVSSNRLRAIMDSINRSVADDTDSGAIPGAIDPAQLAQLIEAIEELLYHAELMSGESAPRKLGDSEVVTFRALASQLYTEALNVRTIAAGNPVDTYDFNLLNAAHERLYQTCTACHDLFRDR